jgi:hypothetical protein
MLFTYANYLPNLHTLTGENVRVDRMKCFEDDNKF